MKRYLFFALLLCVTVGASENGRETILHDMAAGGVAVVANDFAKVATKEKVKLIKLGAAGLVVQSVIILPIILSPAEGPCCIL